MPIPRIDNVGQGFIPARFCNGVIPAQAGIQRPENGGFSAPKVGATENGTPEPQRTEPQKPEARVSEPQNFRTSENGGLKTEDLQRAEAYRGRSCACPKDGGKKAKKNIRHGFNGFNRFNTFFIHVIREIRV